MCVIVHQPEGSHLEKDRAKRLWDVNSHGGGFAYITDTGSIEIYKAMEFDRFWSAFEQTRSANPRRDFLLHMRIKTHGPVNLENVHPFMVDEHTVMAHNGIIHGVRDDKELSDTRVFIRDVVKDLPKDWLDRPEFVDMVEDWIGWSKLMFLTTSPHLSENVYILNSQKGKTADGMWFSNDNGLYERKATKAISRPTVYQPGEYRFTGYSEDQAFPDWLEDRKASVTMAQFKELEKERAEIGILSPMMRNYRTGDTKCLTCLVPVDTTSPGCDCWTLICRRSGAPAAICDECEKGCYSTRDFSELVKDTPAWKTAMAAIDKFYGIDKEATQPVEEEEDNVVYSSHFWDW